MERFSKATPSERRDYLLMRYQALKSIRAPYLRLWGELVKYIVPYSGCFTPSDKMGYRTQRYIFDPKAERCLDVLVGGLSTYATPPSLPWFRLVIDGSDYKYDHDVQAWLNQVQGIILDVLRKSNTYRSLHELYANLCVFGTAASVVYEDPRNVIHHHVLPLGSFCIQNNDKGDVSVLYREFVLTAAQAVAQFGLDKLSSPLRHAYEQGNLEAEFHFLHAIEPREDRDLSSSSNLDMEYASYYVELGADNSGILKESGFPYFPCIVPRWQVSGNEPYGISPAIKALPDVKQLMHATYRLYELVDNLVEPALQVPYSARQTPISLASKSINFVPSTGADQAIKPIVQSTGNIDVISQEIDKLHQRLQEGFYYDAFLMLQNFASTRKTATEVQVLKEEKMAMLGPVVERLQQECQSPLITIPYEILLRAGALPQPPAALGGKSFDIDFEGLLAQSQKSVGINPTNQFLGAVQSLSASFPDIADRLDPDGLVDVYAYSYGVDRHILRSKEQADEMRQARAQAQAQAQSLAAGESLTNSISSLAQAQKAGAEASLATQQLDPVTNIAGTI